jgi:hypothetical protein
MGSSAIQMGFCLLPSDKEPQLLVLDAFVAHKGKTDQEMRDENDFVEEFKKLNTTISIVPAGGTGYMQVLDGFINKKIKEFELIQEEEEIHYNLYETEWKSGKFSVGDGRVLLAEWMLKAYNLLHENYRESIIKPFEQVGLSLSPDGSEDWKLKIRDLPSLFPYSSS